MPLATDKQTISWLQMELNRSKQLHGIAKQELQEIQEALIVLHKLRVREWD